MEFETFFFGILIPFTHPPASGIVSTPRSIPRGRLPTTSPSRPYTVGLNLELADIAFITPMLVGIFTRSSRSELGQIPRFCYLRMRVTAIPKCDKLSDYHRLQAYSFPYYDNGLMRNPSVTLPYLSNVD